MRHFIYFNPAFLTFKDHSPPPPSVYKRYLSTLTGWMGNYSLVTGLIASFGYTSIFLPALHPALYYAAALTTNIMQGGSSPNPKNQDKPTKQEIQKAKVEIANATKQIKPASISDLNTIIHTLSSRTDIFDAVYPSSSDLEQGNKAPYGQLLDIIKGALTSGHINISATPQVTTLLTMAPAIVIAIDDANNLTGFAVLSFLDLPFLDKLDAAVDSEILFVPLIASADHDMLKRLEHMCKLLHYDTIIVGTNTTATLYDTAGYICTKHPNMRNKNKHGNVTCVKTLVKHSTSPASETKRPVSSKKSNLAITATTRKSGRTNISNRTRARTRNRY